MAVVKKPAKDTVKAVVAAEKEKEALKKALVEDPNESKKAAELEKRIASVQKVLDSGVLSADITEGVKDLSKYVTDKKEEIKETYSIEVQAGDLVAMVNAHNTLQAQLEDEAKQNQAALDADYAAKEAEWKGKIADLENTFNENTVSYKKQMEQLQNDTALDREREEKNYQYDLNRKHSIADDEWNDQKAVREAELAKKEADLKDREYAVTAQEALIAELQDKVAQIPDLVANATEEGKKAGRAEAEKESENKIRYMEQQHESDNKLNEEKIANLTAQREEDKAEIASLKESVADTYQSMKELMNSVSGNMGKINVVSSAPASQSK